MLLHIGGCDHFTYSAKYLTAASALASDSSVLTKARWMAKSFFSNGFDQGFVRTIDKGSFAITRDAHTTTITLAEGDTTHSDHIYEPILVEKTKGRARISLVAYQD